MSERQNTRSLQIPTSDGNGSPSHLWDMKNNTIHIGGTFSANIKLQGSLDQNLSADSWFDITGASTSSSWTFNIKENLYAIRAVVSSYVSGTPIGTIRGLQRAD